MSMSSKVVAVILVLGMMSCDTDQTVDLITYDAAAMLSNTADSVILQTYVDLDLKAAALVTAVQNLASVPTEEHLQQARAAWKAARSPWEMSEGFLFGPVDTKGIDPDIDSWPVNVTDLDAVLSGSATLTESYISGLEGTLKGFHTIEYLLFGNGSTLKDLSSFTSRELEYLIGCSLSFRTETLELKNSWDPNGENYVAHLKNAGETTSLYISQKAAVEELLQGLINIADEVANGKIQDPYAQMDATLEESRFSNNSKADFQDNIRSIQNIYTGVYAGLGTGNAEGLSDLIRGVDPALDDHVRSQIDEAISLIGYIGGSDGTFGNAIINDRPSVVAAQTAVRALQETLQSDVQSIVNRLQ